MGQLARKFEVVEGGCAIPSIQMIEQPIAQPLNNPGKWLTVGDLVGLSGVSQQAVSKAMSAARWRGADLLIRRVEVGRGGAGGMAPQVHVDSLPADLREDWYLSQGITLHAEVDPTTGETRLVPDAVLRNDPKWEDRAAVARWRLNIIRPLVQNPKGSPERKALADEYTSHPWPGLDGKAKHISRATLYAWVAAYEADGLLGLMPAERKDKGKSLVLVTTVWDGFFAGRITTADHQRIGDDITHYMQSLWASGESGWRVICEKSTTRLIEMTRDLRDVRFDMLPIGRMTGQSDAGTQFGLCCVNRRLAEKQRNYRVVAIRNKDNARYQDTIAPTIRRDYALLKPREIVVGDVHPTDIMILRPDGTRAYPKAISWFDPSTNEIHMTVVLLEQGEGIRREHVAMAFEAMVADWGLPKLLYLDNGSEYGWAEMIDGFTALSKLAGMTVKEYGEGSLVDARVAEARQAAIRSLAYNAKGKPGIEGSFGNLEQVFFSNIDGWTAGDRMRKKTHAKGRDPIPFPGDMVKFMGVISTHLEHYHKRPQYGRLAGNSPNEALRTHIERGWGKTMLAAPEVLALAFSTEIERVPDRGCISYAPRDGRSQRYYLDKLLGLLPGTTVTARVPAYDPQFLFVFDAAGDLLGIARPEQSYHPLDVRGAHELGARQKYLRRHISQKSRHVALLDLTEETRRHIGHLPEAPDVPVAAVVDAGMLERMAQVEAEERARLAAAEDSPRRAPSQWGTRQNAALTAVTFEEEDE